jgi:hypothetical protein
MVALKCERCLKVFAHKGTYLRHINRVNQCHVVEDMSSNIINDLNCKIQQQDQKIKDLQEDMVKKIEMYQHKLDAQQDKIDAQQDEIRQLHDLIEEKNQHIQALLTKSTKSEKIKINNSNVTINLTTFGKENKNDLNRRELITVLNAGDSCFLSMIRHIHANARLPHYQNVCVTNLRATGAYIFENNEWNYSDYDNILYLLMTARMSDLDELVRDKDLAQEIRNISRVKAVVDNYWDDTDKFVKQNKHRIINLLYNYTKNNMNGSIKELTPV